MAPQNQKRKKERNNDLSDSDPEICVEPTSSWSRFLVIQGTDPEKPLQKLSPFAVAKGIKGLAGEPKKVNRLHSGDLLVEVGQRCHSDNLLRSTELAGIPITVSPHKYLNFKKGIVRCQDLKHCNVTEILEGLADQHVKDVYRISITKDGNKIPTGTLILTFDLSILPKEIKVGYLSVRVEAYIPNPVRCFKCQRYGHNKNYCKHGATCPKCGKEDHEEEACREEPHCINCDGDHPAFSKSCPKWVQEKEIQKLKHTLNLSYKDARQIVEKRTPVPGISYAAMAKRVEKISIGTQTTLTWPKNSKNLVNIIDSNSVSSQTSPESTSTPSVTSRASGGGSSTSAPVKSGSGSGSSTRPPGNSGSATSGSSGNKHDSGRSVNKTSPSGRLAKGSDDPIKQYNRFRVLDGDGEEESMVVDKAPPSHHRHKSKERPPGERQRSKERGDKPSVKM